MASHGSYDGDDDEDWQPSAPSERAPCSAVELSLSGRNLPKKDARGKSDPMCILYVKSLGSNEWKEHGRTETIPKNLNPDFQKKLEIDYHFEESQKLKFELYDIDVEGGDNSQQDFLGRLECSLGEIINSGMFEKPLDIGTVDPKKTKKKSKKPKAVPTIIIHAEELTACKDLLTLQFRGLNLAKKKASDPFLKLCKKNEKTDTNSVLHTTEVQRGTPDPTWAPFEISVRSLCNEDYNKPVSMECYNWKKNGKHDLLGTIATEAKVLSGEPGLQKVFEISNPKTKKSSKKPVEPMKVEIVKAHRDTNYTFLDYFKGGTEIHCIVAVDFASKDPSIHHDIKAHETNLYIKALRAVGEILEDYDSDKLFPALGFGASLPTDDKGATDFFLNGDKTNPYCQGIEGVIQAYRSASKTVKPERAAKMAGVINCAAATAKQSKAGTDYYVLMLISGGTVADMANTCEAIVQASSLPLSIIIVGIGEVDFTVMDVLDADEKKLTSKGRAAERDIVQFVAFSDFLNTKDRVSSEALLTKAVLGEVPDQFMSYMKKNKIDPSEAKVHTRSAPLEDDDDDDDDEFDDE